VKLKPIALRSRHFKEENDRQADTAVCWSGSLRTRNNSKSFAEGLSLDHCLRLGNISVQVADDMTC
jgi:hypothetical protein